MSNDAAYQAYSPCFPEEEQGEWVWVPKKLGTTPGYLITPHQSPDLNQHMYHSFSEGSSETSTPAMPWAPSPVGPAAFPMDNEFSGSLTVSPVEPLLEGFDLDLALEVHAYLEGTEQPWAVPANNTASMDLFNCMDANLFSGFDFSLPLDGTPFPPPSTASPTSPLHGTLAFPLTTLSPVNPPTPTSPLTSHHSPTSTIPTTTTTATTQLLPCSEPSCTQLFTQRSDLRKHERKHRQPFRCPLPACGKGHLDKRALARHLWAKHPEHAAQQNTRSEKVRCAYPGCAYEGRADNVARHGKRHCK